MSHVLLVADPGGHLALLHWLRPALGARRCTWVSLDAPDVRPRVGSDAVIFGAGPTPRSAAALVRNLRHASSSLPRLRPDLVLTSGSALGVPWVWAARARGVTTAFLEVADRVHTPSLSLRLVRPVVDHLLVQDAAARGFRRDAHVLGRVAPPPSAIAPRTGPVFVAMGTSPFPFERLVRAAEDLAAAGHDVVVQHGASRPPAGCRTVRHLDPDAFREAMAGARVVVLHGGLACRAEARASGRVPLVVPRRGTLGEHVDDHQVHAARADAAFVVEPGQLVAAVAAWSEPLVRPAREEETTERFRAWLDQVCPST